MKTGYHIQVLTVSHLNATSRVEQVLFELRTIKNRQKARVVFGELRLYYPEPLFVVKCHHTDHIDTLTDLEDF